MPSELMTPGMPTRGACRPVNSAVLEAEQTGYPLYQVVNRRPRVVE